MASLIFNLNGNDNTLIDDTRATFMQPIIATNWTDLRLTIACSITSALAPDQQSGLAELYPSAGDQNHFYMGFKQSDGNLPPSTNFWGLSSNQVLVPASPAQLYDQGGNWYQVGNNNTIATPLLLSNGTTKQNSGVGVANGPLFFEGASPAANYSNVIMLRMRRNDPTLNVVNTLEAALNPVIVGLPVASFVSNTTVANLRALTAAATFTTILGPFTFSSVPDAIYWFWPFANSRLRIHDYVLEKYA